MVIKVGDKWCKATTTWKFWWNFLAKSILFSRYPSFSPFERPDAYKCYTFSESYGSRETREIKISTSKFDLEAQGILSPLWTQTGPWSDTASYCHQLILVQKYQRGCSTEGLPAIEGPGTILLGCLFCVVTFFQNISWREKILFISQMQPVWLFF